MPGPFPGMDPYLEARRFWKGFHGSLITEIVGNLNHALPAPFAADVDERVYAISNVAYPQEERERFIEIRTGVDWEQIVTIIEVLSPSNKRDGGLGRDAY